MRLILLIALWLCLSIAVRCDDDDREEATVTEELPEGVAEETEEVVYVSPTPNGHIYFAEHFDVPEEFEAKWIRSQAKKEGIDEEIAKYDGKWAVESLMKDGLKGDLGLVLKSKAKHAAISAPLDRPFVFTNKPLIVQYDVTFQNGQECGGAYIKLLTQETGMRLSQFTDKTPYTIMFGPDKCGNDHKLHFIFQHKNPKDGSFSEKHAKKPNTRLDEYFKDGKPHLYTLMIHPDNTFDVSVDYKIVNKGTLLEDFSPPVNPPSEIDDPEDRKPDDWDEREKIADPDAKKPDDWDEDEPEQVADADAVKPDGWLDDEPEMIPDPSAEKPEDWDEDMDGTWEAPLINNPSCESAPGCGLWKAPMKANPKFKGKWRAAMIDNPNYRGKWRPRRIPNPDFFEDKHPFNMASIGAVGLEIWSMSDNILFDNFIITDDKIVSEQWAAETFDLKRNLVDRDQESVVQRLMNYTNKNPWLWAVYVIVVGLPLVLIFTFCCNSQEKQDAARAALQKKTDEAGEDDEGGDDQQNEDESEGVPPLEGEEDEVKDDDNAKDDEAEEEGSEDAAVPEEPAVEKGTRRRARKD
ncbi:calnexin-like isoform X2 [Daphnia pulex]|uniref:calnexin-like isoform X2 n=2 Tax=Daphnia TaxID=6668 RepID=UPI001EDFAD7E|nr:calnexin-like isoform X2 [Daphnia pulex]XP_046442798.1 calnexin-like isoform X2 [Daphnia pulex]XP_046648775.1 calnexin-like isoform X2 [Daphnia pulicaria]